MTYHNDKVISWKLTWRIIAIAEIMQRVHAIRLEISVCV